LFDCSPVLEYIKIRAVLQSISRVGNLGAMLAPVSGAISCHLKEM